MRLYGREGISYYNGSVGLLSLQVHVFVMCLCLLCGGVSIPSEGEEEKGWETKEMCWLQGTCLVLEEGGGTVPAEIAVTLNLMYTGDVDYLWSRQAIFQNMPFPLLDSLNMTFTPPSVARRNVRGIVTHLMIMLQDFEEIGPFLSQGFNELTDLTIKIVEQSRRTRVRSDMLTGIPKLERLSIALTSSRTFNDYSLNTIPNIFSPFRCTNGSDSSSVLHYIKVYIRHGDISLWRLDDICTKAPITLVLSAVVLPIPSLSGPLRPFLTAPPKNIEFRTLPYPPIMASQKEAPPLYWDMLCDSLEGITDPTMSPFYVAHHDQKIDLSFTIGTLSDVERVSSQVHPPLYRERCPVALDFSSWNMKSFTVDGFTLGRAEVGYFNQIQPKSFSVRNCNLTLPSLFNSLKYNELLTVISIEYVYVNPFLQNVQLSLPLICWGGRCESIEIDSSQGVAIQFDNAHGKGKTNYTYLHNLKTLRLDGNEFRDYGLWTYLATRGPFVNNTLTIRYPYFTFDQLFAIFPCAAAHARYGASAAEQCCKSIREGSNLYAEVTLRAAAMVKSYNHIYPPVRLNEYWLCGVQSVTLEGIPVFSVANDVRKYSTFTGRLELRSSALRLVEEESLSQTRNVIIKGAQIRNITKPLSSTGFNTFEVSDGHVSEFDMSSLGPSKLGFLVNGVFGGLSYLDMSRNRIATLVIEDVYTYFQCYFGSPEKIWLPRRCFIDFHMNNLSKVKIMNDIPIRADTSHRNISKLFKDEIAFEHFEALYSTFANIVLDLSSNHLRVFPRESIHSLRGLRFLFLANNSMEILEGGFLSGPSCIGTGCYVDLSFNRLGENISALEDALRIQSRNYSDAVIHTLDLRNNKLESVPKYSTAIAGSISRMVGQIARPSMWVVDSFVYPSYFTLTLQHNGITFVNESLCFGVDQSEDVTIYVDLSHNNISFVSDEAFKCGRARLLVNLNYNPHLELLPKFWYGRVSSLMLLSVKGTSIRHIPESYKTLKENVFGLQSFNLDWSYEWSCCDLAYVEELDPSSSLIALDPSESDVTMDNNLIFDIYQQVQLNWPGTSFTSKRCVFKKRKMRYFEFRKAVPDFKDVCSIDTNPENKATNSLFLTLWVILWIQLYCMTVVYAIHFELNKAKGPSLVVEIAFPGSYLFKNAMYELDGAYYGFPGDDGPQKLKVKDVSLEYLAGYREVPSGYQYTATVDEDLYYN